MLVSNNIANEGNAEDSYQWFLHKTRLVNNLEHIYGEIPSAYLTYNQNLIIYL